MYDEMGWNKGSRMSANPPVVGYGDGEGRGFQAQLGPDPATFLSNGLLVYRIDQPFTEATAETAVNKGNVAQSQQKDDDDDGGKVIVQRFKEKEDLKKGLAEALQEVEDAEQQKKKESVKTAAEDVIVQHFEDMKKD